MRPGGWIELSTTIPDILSDDNTLPPNCSFKEASNAFIEIGELTGVSAFAPRQWNAQMHQAGFVNVHDIVLKIPSGPWPKDQRLRKIGAIERLSLLKMAKYTFLDRREPSLKFTVGATSLSRTRQISTMLLRWTMTKVSIDLQGESVSPSYAKMTIATVARLFGLPKDNICFEQFLTHNTLKLSTTALM